MRLKTERAIPVQRAAYFSCRTVRWTGTLMPALLHPSGQLLVWSLRILGTASTPGLLLKDADGLAGPVGGAGRSWRRAEKQVSIWVMSRPESPSASLSSTTGSPPPRVSSMVVTMPAPNRGKRCRRLTEGESEKRAGIFVGPEFGTVG